MMLGMGRFVIILLLRMTRGVAPANIVTTDFNPLKNVTAMISPHNGRLI